jgi:transporter family protein
MEDFTLLAIFFAFVAAISWGFGDFLAAKAAKTVGVITTALYTNVLGAILYATVYLLFLDPSGTPWSSGGAFAAVGGCVITLAFYVFCKALVAGPVSAVVPISASYPLFTTVIALLIFGAVLSGLQAFAIAIIVIGVMAISGLFTLSKSERRIRRGPALGLLSALLFGIGFSLAAQAVERIGWQTATLVQTVSASLFFMAAAPLLQGNERVFRNFNQKITNRWVVLQSVAGLAGLVAINIAFRYDPTSGAVVSAISACYPVLTIWLALKHFKEEARLIPLAGAAVSIAGVVILSIG